MEAANEFYKHWVVDNQQAKKSNIQRLDEALGLYYKRMKRNDYYDDDDDDDKDKGKFLKYFEEHHYESDELDDELGEDSNFKDCCYVKFDIFNDFPLNDNIKKRNKNEREMEIFRILQHCYKFDIPPTTRNELNESIQDLTEYNILSSDDENKYNDNNNIDNHLKTENQMLWNKVHSFNTKIDELNYEINLLKQESNGYKQKSMKLENNYNELLLKYKTLLISKEKTNNFEKWNCEIVIEWILNLENGRFKQKYKKLPQKLREENITGKYLIALNRNDLHRLSITDFRDKIDILQHIKGLKQ